MQVYRISERTFKHQHNYTNSLHCSPSILLSTSWENFFIHQDNSSLLIISLILVTFKCYNDEVKFDSDQSWALKG